jgi:hypothetical protein
MGMIRKLWHIIGIVNRLPIQEQHLNPQLDTK